MPLPIPTTTTVPICQCRPIPLLNSLLLYFLLHLALLFPSSNLVHSHMPISAEFCDHAMECVAKVRRMAMESNRFWFGDQWHFQCAGSNLQQHHLQHGHRQQQQQQQRNQREGGGGGAAVSSIKAGGRTFSVGEKS